MTPDDPVPPDLAALLADLPDEIAPSSDLWDGIAEEITPVPLPTLGRASWAGPVLLAAVALFGAIGLSTLRPAFSPAEPEPIVIASMSWEQDIRRTTDELQRVLESHRDHMDPEALAVIGKALADIDAAIADVQRALRDDPDNDALQTALAQVWQTKVHLLRTATEEAG